ncbi:MAG: LysR substrate-binding domain-containing protein [Bacillota bacterium]
MNIKQLEAFLLIAQLKNFTKAASQLDMSQPAISFQIKSLEEDLNITLFERNDKKVVLTEAGRLLYPVAMQMVRQYNKIRAGIDGLRELKAGHLMLGAAPVAGEWLLPVVIGGFREQYPAVTVSLQIGSSARVSQWLKDRDVNVAILGVPVKAEGIECQPWTRDNMVIITPPWHPYKGREVPLADLTHETIILPEAGSGGRLAIESQFSKHGVSLDQFASCLELGSVQAQINAVRMGLGISAVSRWAAWELLENGSLGGVAVPDLNINYDIYIAWNCSGNEGLASNAFRSFVTDKEITGRLIQGLTFFHKS